MLIPPSHRSLFFKKLLLIELIIGSLESFLVLSVNYLISYYPVEQADEIYEKLIMFKVKSEFLTDLNRYVLLPTDKVVYFK